MFSRLFGAKKQPQNGKVKKSKEGFYVEIEETKDSQDTPAAQQIEETKTEVPEAPKEVKAPKEAKADKNKKTSAKKTKTEEVAEPQVVQNSDTPEWVKLLYKNKQDDGAVHAEQDNTFADKYLLFIPTKTRRRPGASLNKYMDMASQIKLPKVRR